MATLNRLVTKKSLSDCEHLSTSCRPKKWTVGAAPLSSVFADLSLKKNVSVLSSWQSYVACSLHFGTARMPERESPNVWNKLAMTNHRSPSVSLISGRYSSYLRSHLIHPVMCRGPFRAESLHRLKLYTLDCSSRHSINRSFVHVGTCDLQPVAADMMPHLCVVYFL